MQDKNQNTQGSQTQAAAQAKETAEAVVNRAAHGDFVTKIVEKVKASENILVALSKNPSVDEICAAIGLTLFLDGLQHHVTAIYSGRTPNALAFLQPEATFETNTASLQDFIIALDKNKADHLRYKLEGDFVKVFITPYRTSISEEDLSFSRGDFNVDFVIAINVRSAGDLDEALSEHGRIMHDASIVDITRNEPGRFGEIEWSNQVASSVSEMVTQLVFAIQGSDKPLDQDVATALLTGIVAATERFSNNRTNPDTLTLASKLMSMGADQQLISANVVGNNLADANAPQPEEEPTPEPQPLVPSPDTVPEPVMMGGTVVLPNVAANPAAQAVASVPEAVGPAPADVTIPPMKNDTFVLPTMPSNAPTPAAPNNAPAPMMPNNVSAPTMPNPPAQAPVMPAPSEVTIQPQPAASEAPKDYANMLEEALKEPVPSPAPSAMPTVNAPVAEAPAPVANVPVPGAMPPMPDPAQMNAPGEPVAKPATVLPPPPIPPAMTDANGIPTLPPVQMPPQQ